MNHARAGELPLIRLDKIHWFRSVEERYQFEPPLVHTNRTRFNRGDLQVIYFAPDQVLARFEARDVLGHWFGDAVPASAALYLFRETPSLARRPALGSGPDRDGGNICSVCHCAMSRRLGNRRPSDWPSIKGTRRIARIYG